MHTLENKVSNIFTDTSNQVVFTEKYTWCVALDGSPHSTKEKKIQSEITWVST